MIRVITPFLFSVALLATVSSLYSQEPLGFVLPPGKNHVDIPFEEYSNLIVIPVGINNRITLKFILDTGSESLVLTEKLFGEVLNLNYSRSISVLSPGLADSVHARVATNVSLGLPGNLAGKGFHMMVLEEDYLQLSECLGEEIYGIIGYDLFHRFVVQIDYDHHVLHIYDPESFKPGKLKAIPMSVINTKPYVQMCVSDKNHLDTVNLMVDCGASHALLLDVGDMRHIAMPEHLIEAPIGQGLAGEIPGQIGRLDGAALSTFPFHQILTSIPDEGMYMKAVKRGARHGTIGGELLSRFMVTFDYPHQILYLRKGSRYGRNFEFNMSGLVLTAVGNKLDSIYVQKVRSGSAGEEADIRVGDYVLKVNGQSLHTNRLSELHDLLHKRNGKRIKMIIWRDEEKIKRVFRLKRII